MDIMWNSLILIFVGWFLSELTRLLIGRRENKQSINKAIFPILNIKLSLEHFISILKSIEHKESLDDERMDLLKIMWNDDSIKKDSFILKLDNSVNEVSSLDPIIALDLNLLISTSKEFVDNKFFFDGIKRDFKKSTSIQLKGLQLFTKSIDKIIRKLFFRHSKILYIRYLIYHNRNKKSKDFDWNELFS